MATEYRVKLFRDGPHQAVRIPQGLELPGNEAIIRREGERLIIEPAPRASVLTLLATLTPIEEGFGETNDPPPEAQEL